MRRNSLTECCVGLVFSSPAASDERDQRHVQVDHVLGPGLAPELADGFEERERLDVADRPADLRDDDVRVVASAARADPVLDLVVMCGMT